MTKNVWRPDTCGCILEFEFDADTTEQDRIHTPTQTIRACEHHQIADVKECHDVVLEENVRKNVVLNSVLDQVAPELQKDVSWSFDEKREVVISVPASEKDKITLTHEKARLA